MIKSMTAYGRGEAEGPNLKWVVELRTVNHRFLEFSLNLPRWLWGLEDRFRKRIKARVARGRVDMQLSWEYQGERTTTLKLDQVLVGDTRQLLQDLEAAAGLAEPLRLEHFLHFSDLLVGKERDLQEDPEAAWVQVSKAADQALDSLEEMRLAEGAALAADLAGHLETIRGEMAAIAAQAPLLPSLWKERVASRLAELFPEGAPVDETRLAQEVALLADRRDISEELARLDSHLSQFQQTLEATGQVGRKLEFLLQEMLREINTIGSKAADLAISQSVLEIKGALERLREQVQNIE